MNARLKSGRSAVRPPLTTDQLATSGPVTRPNILHYWICSAPQVTVAARRRPPFAVRWGTRGARRMILSMRTLGGEVIGGRWGRSPVLRQLAGGVRGQRRLPYLCIERHPATNLMGNDLLADIAAVTDSSPPVVILGWPKLSSSLTAYQDVGPGHKVRA